MRGPASRRPGRASGAVLAVLLAAALFGTAGTAHALGPPSATSLGAGAARGVIGGLALVALLPVTGTRRAEATALWRTPAGVAAGVCTALYGVCFLAGVERAGVAVGTLVAVGSGPVLAGLLARGLLGERAGRAWLAATALCLTGLTLLVLGGASQAGPAAAAADGAPGLDAAGVGLALGAGLAYAGYTVLAKGQLDAGHAPPAVMAGAFGLGALLLLPVLLTQPLGWLGQPRGAVLALYLGLVTMTLAYTLFVRGLAVLPAGPVTTLVLAEPVVATALGVAVLGERLPASGAVGAALLLVGLLLQGRGATRPSSTGSPDPHRGQRVAT